MVVITAGKDPCYFPMEFFKIKDLRVLIMCRSCKRLSHVSINNSTEINEKFARGSSSWLANIYTGTGHSHLDS